MLEMARGSEESRGADVGRVPSELEGNLLEVMPTFTEDENCIPLGRTGIHVALCCWVFPLNWGEWRLGKER